MRRLRREAGVPTLVAARVIVRRALIAALGAFAALTLACETKSATPDAGALRDAGKDAAPAASAKTAPFVPVPGAAPGPALLLSSSRGLLVIDVVGKRTQIAMPDARVLDVAMLTDGQVYVVESKGLRKIVGKSAVKVHAFGERMAADVEGGATVLPGPEGAISVLGEKRFWLGGKPGWKGTGRSAVVAVARDRMADADAAPNAWGIDADGGLRLQNGDAWDLVNGFEAGLLAKNAVLAIAPAASGVYVLREEGLYRIPGRSDPGALVAPLTAVKGSRLRASVSGVAAIRDPSGKLTIVAPTGEIATPDALVGEVFAVDDLGRVWSRVDGTVTVVGPTGPPTKLPRTSDLADLVGIAVQGGGPAKGGLGK